MGRSLEEAVFYERIGRLYWMRPYGALYRVLRVLERCGVPKGAIERIYRNATKQQSAEKRGLVSHLMSWRSNA